MFYSQRLDLSALTHDQGPDITKAVFLSVIHSIECFNHQLDNSVKAGIDCPEFNPIFVKATTIVTTIRASNNIYRRLRDNQVMSTF